MLWLFMSSNVNEYPQSVFMEKYRSNYSTVCLGFSKLLGTLSSGKICIYLLRVHCKKDQERTYLIMIMRFFFFSDFLYKDICCGTHLNCIDKSMQFK